MVFVIRAVILSIGVVVEAIELQNTITPVICDLDSVSVTIGKPIGILHGVLLSEPQAAKLLIKRAYDIAIKLLVGSSSFVNPSNPSGSRPGTGFARVVLFPSCFIQLSDIKPVLSCNRRI